METFVSSTKITIPMIPSLDILRPTAGQDAALTENYPMDEEMVTSGLSTSTEKHSSVSKNKPLGNLSPTKGRDTTLSENCSIDQIMSGLPISTDINSISKSNNIFSSMSGSAGPDLPISTDINSISINNNIFSSLNGNTEQANINRSNEVKALSYENGFEKNKPFIETGQQIATGFSNNETMQFPVNMASRIRSTNFNSNFELAKSTASFNQINANLNTNAGVNSSGDMNASSMHNSFGFFAS